jgi:hypothetical protein
MTRSKEMRRIETALSTKDASELRWALAECELRKRFMKKHSDRWYQIEKAIRRALAATGEQSVSGEVAGGRKGRRTRR